MLCILVLLAANVSYAVLSESENCQQKVVKQRIKSSAVTKSLIFDWCTCVCGSCMLHCSSFKSIPCNMSRLLFQSIVLLVGLPLDDHDLLGVY